MKHLILSTLLICFKIVTAQEVTNYDTLFYTSGELKSFEIIKSAGVMKNNLKVGLWKSWYSNGNIKEQGEYAILLKKDIKIINHTACNECIIDEKAMREKFKDTYAIETGKWESYYKNGRLMETGSYLPIWEINIEWAELINENNSIEYVSNGIPSYPQAMKTGVWMQFEDNGKLSDKTTYVNGKIINNTK